MAEVRRRWPKVVMIVILCLLGLVVCAIIVLNLYVRFAFAQFFANAEQVFPIPGIGLGFVPQDQDYVEDEDLWVFSGYMGDGSPSPLIKRATDGQITQIFVDLPDGSVYDGHGGGVTSEGEFMYLTTAEGYTVLPLAAVISAGEGEHVQALGNVALEVAPAFINVEDGVLYAGDFYYPGPYETPEREHLATPDGSMNHAIMYAYPSDPTAPYGFADQVERVYSIPDCVQGFCTDDEGDFILSTSVAINPSRFLIYDRDGLQATGTYHADGRDVELVSLYEGNLTQTITAPPMAEGIEWLDGRFYYGDESASNKYLFGKLYGAGSFYAVDPSRFPVETTH